MAIVNKFNVNREQVTLDVIYDVTVNNNGATFASLSELLSSENLSTLIPVAVRYGGMSIKFIQSFGNKYVQYRLMSDSFNTTVSNWQGVDDEPVDGSENLVKSGGVADVSYAIEGSLYKDVKGFVKGYYTLLNDTIDVDAPPNISQYIYCKKLKVKAGQKFCYKNGRSSSQSTWPWAITDNSGNILTRGESRSVKTFYISITQDGYLFVNCDAGYLSSLVFYRMSEIDKVNDRVSEISNTLIEVEYGANCLYPYLESHYNTLLNENGDIYASNGWYTSQPIYWGSHSEIKISRRNYCFQYDARGKVVANNSSSTIVTNTTVIRAEGACYLMFNVDMAKKDTTIATFCSEIPNGVIPFFQKIKKINGIVVNNSDGSIIPSLFREKKYTIIGDSISTFGGYDYYSGPYTYPSTTIAFNVNDVIDTWWGKWIDATDGKLIRNLSVSGSCVAQRDGHNSLYQRAHDIVGSEDYVIIALGCNDSIQDIPLGNYEYDKPISELSESEFIPAYIKGIKYIQETFPNIEIILGIIDVYNSSKRAAIRNIAKNYNLKCLDSSNYYLSYPENNAHPDVIGHQTIFNAFLDSIVMKLSNGKPDGSNSLKYKIYNDIISERYKTGTLSYDSDGNVITPINVVFDGDIDGTISLQRDTEGLVTLISGTYGNLEYLITITRNTNGDITTTNITIN